MVEFCYRLPMVTRKKNMLVDDDISGGASTLDAQFASGADDFFATVGLCVMARHSTCCACSSMTDTYNYLD